MPEPNLPSWLFPSFALVYGLVIGSFLNVVIYRLPLGKSIVRPRSGCPSCGEPIAGYDNLPVLSWVLLRGKCRRCHAGISIRYPAIELSVGAISLIAFLQHGPTLEYAVVFGFAAAMVVLIFIDYDHQILPDSITLGGWLLGFLLAAPREALTLVEAISGAALGAGLLYFVSEVYFRLRKIEGLGFGDVKMMGMVGAFVGWKGVLLTLFLGSFSGSLVGVGLVMLRGGDMKTKLPFGTFLGMGALAAIFVGEPVIDWYSGLF